MAKVNLEEMGTNEVEVQAALDLLRRTREQRAKQAEKVKNDPEAKAKASVRAARLRVKDTLLKHKAIAAGIVVTDADVDAYLAKG